MVTVKVLDLMNELERTHNNALSRWQQLKRLLEQQQAVEQKMHPTLLESVPIIDSDGELVGTESIEFEKSQSG